MVDRETSLKVKCLRSDNGGEYIDGEFNEYCVAQGIRMEKTIPGTPQQNGVAECMNITLNKRAKSMRLHAWSMRLHAGLSKTFWADAVSTATYLINDVHEIYTIKYSHIYIFSLTFILFCD